MGDSLGVEIDILQRDSHLLVPALEAERTSGWGQIDLAELSITQLVDGAPNVQALDLPADDQISAAMTSLGTADGERRYVPHRMSWPAMIYNADIIPSPPSTWEELVEVAEANSGKIVLKASSGGELAADLLPFL